MSVQVPSMRSSNDELVLFCHDLVVASGKFEAYQLFQHTLFRIHIHGCRNTATLKSATAVSWLDIETMLCGTGEAAILHPHLSRKVYDQLARCTQQPSADSRTRVVHMYKVTFEDVEDLFNTIIAFGVMPLPPPARPKPSTTTTSTTTTATTATATTTTTIPPPKPFIHPINEWDLHAHVNSSMHTEEDVKYTSL